ncbi:uncharacterized protein LOC121644062 isoform X2 [Melanotaenia boesemani]|nr:uncharacterized protein LOC121644062 isoform X2 [Melanotaenia boesemani]
MAPALSAAEMQRRYRERRDADPKKREEYLRKEREKWQKDRETGKKKRIRDLSQREQRAQRKKWRQRKRDAKSRERPKEATPPLFQKLSMQESSVQLFFVTEKSVDEMQEIPPLTTIKGTMKMHQIISTTTGLINYRDITCLCQKDKGVMDCPCFDLREATLQATLQDVASDVPTTEPLWRPDIITSSHVGRWCVVMYDDDPYPGIILAVEDNNIQVNCMHRNGINKFYWPGPRKDVNWYADSQVLCLTEEPQVLNKRSVQLHMATWRYVQDQIAQ